MQYRRRQRVLLAATILVAWSAPAIGQTFGPAQLSPQTRECLECHQKTDKGIYQQWGASKHFGANVGCYECHSAQSDDVDAFVHEGYTIAILVTPKDCGRCHTKEAEEFTASHHAKAGRILGSLDNVLAEVVEGNRGMITPGFPGGVAASAVNGCWQCHGSEIKVIGNGKLDPATYPNSGIGRINPDGSEGACSACHVRHEFAVEQVRHPDTCGKCHMGPDHPQIEIYNESKHGIAFRSNIDEMNMDSPKWIVGEDYWAAPTCATCHMSATPTQPVTHDVGMRISWNNRPAISIRPEVSDAKLGLPGKDVPWQVRRANMQDVCLNCHQQQWVDNFYIQYDALIEMYHVKFAEPGLALYELAKPLMRPVAFGNKIDFIWFEIWHHEGRRLRHGVSMMGPDYTHWHGTYEVAKHFYTDYVPELEKLVEKNIDSDNPETQAAAQALHDKLEQVLNDENHRWYLGKMDPEEAAKREAAREEFKARYKK